MHKSRLAGFIIDCKDAAPSEAAAFWSEALGMKSLGADGELYERLDAAARDLVIEVQRVSHESRELTSPSVVRRLAAKAKKR